MRKEIELGNEIIKNARSKKFKTDKEYEAIIDLQYFIVIVSQNKETEQSKCILERLRTGYYDEINKKIEVKKEELKLSDDNMQYCFF